MVLTSGFVKKAWVYAWCCQRSVDLRWFFDVGLHSHTVLNVGLRLTFDRRTLIYVEFNKQAMIFADFGESIGFMPVFGLNVDFTLLLNWSDMLVLH